jgi:hypothetical protein
MPRRFNLGLSQSRCEIIIMLGGHCIIENNFLSLCVLTIEADNYGCVGGVINNQILIIREKL